MAMTYNDIRQKEKTAISKSNQLTFTNQLKCNIKNTIKNNHKLNKLKPEVEFFGTLDPYSENFEFTKFIFIN